MADRSPTSIKKFISLVENRPILWDNTLEDYKNKNATQNAWKEIFLDIYPDFETWDESKKHERAKKTIKKWTYIRDTFMKSEKKIARQKVSGNGTKTSKPYLYQKHLLFLKKNMPPYESYFSQMLTSKNDGDTTDTDSNDIDTISEKSSDTSIQLNESQSQPTTNKTSTRKRLLNSNLSSPATKITATDSYPAQVGPINRHLSFFNGLIPSLDNFDDDQVIDFQLGVMQLMKKIKNSQKTQQQVSEPQIASSFHTNTIDHFTLHSFIEKGEPDTP